MKKILDKSGKFVQNVGTMAFVYKKIASCILFQFICSHFEKVSRPQREKIFQKYPICVA